MFSSAEKVKGQGVASAYRELINMLEKRFSDEFIIRINNYQASDISHYHTIDPLFYLSTFLRKTRGVRVGYVHFLPETLKGSIKLLRPIQAIVNWYVTSFYKRMDQLVVVNPSFIEDLVRFGLKREKITYIPNFVSSQTFYPQEAKTKQSFRQELGYQANDFIVLGIGQIQERKGVDDFIQLAIDNPHIQFIWVGGFSFGMITDGYDKYKKIVNEPPANLKFTGIVDRDQINDYYNLADLFLLPSFNELFPMSILESFNCHLPVMLRKLDLYDAVIADKYIETRDVNEMHEKLNDYYQHREKLLPYIEKSKQAAQFYSEDHVAQMWYEYYTGLLENQEINELPPL